MITEVMRLNCPASRAFDMMADARNETRWNSGVKQVELLSGEPIGEGTRFSVTDKRGRHEVTITTWDRPDALSFQVRGDMDVDIVYALSEVDGTTTMTGRFNATARGMMRFFLPFSCR